MLLAPACWRGRNTGKGGSGEGVCTSTHHCYCGSNTCASSSRSSCACASEMPDATKAMQRLNSNLCDHHLTCRTKLESLFQPLVDAISFHDAVSNTDDLLESSFSSHSITRPSCSPPPEPQPPSPSGAPRADNQQPGSMPSRQSGASPSARNGNTHALTSAHHTAAALEESAAQADEEPATASGQNSAAANVGTREARLQGLLEVYEEPDSHAGLYNYAKALEDVEAGLLAGFFYKHFCLASNVIGSESKGMLPCLHLTFSSLDMAICTVSSMYRALTSAAPLTFCHHLCVGFMPQLHAPANHHTYSHHSRQPCMICQHSATSPWWLE